MATTSEPAVSKHLAWVFIQGWVFTPGAFGLHFTDMEDASWRSWALAVSLFGFVGFLLVRNLVRMWQAPASEASRWHVAPLFAVAVAFGLMASGPIVDGSRSARPAGVTYLLLSLTVLMLAVREVVRLRGQGLPDEASFATPGRG